MRRNALEDAVQHSEQPGDGGMRLDKWLWVARFFKTRALAVEAITGGKVDHNDERAKPARQVRPEDRLRIRRGPLEHVVTVKGISLRRGPAAAAALLYVEDAAARELRMARAEQMGRDASAFRYGEGKPSKKDRRAIERLRGRGQ